MSSAKNQRSSQWSAVFSSATTECLEQRENKNYPISRAPDSFGSIPTKQSLGIQIAHLETGKGPGQTEERWLRDNKVKEINDSKKSFKPIFTPILPYLQLKHYALTRQEVHFYESLMNVKSIISQTMGPSEFSYEGHRGSYSNESESFALCNTHFFKWEIFKLAIFSMIESLFYGLVYC